MIMAPGDPRREQHQHDHPREEHAAGRERNNVIAEARQLAARICTRRILNCAVALGVVVIGIVSLPFVQKEAWLQFQCHLNDSHLAQENVRLLSQVKKMRYEAEVAKEKVQQCQNDADSEYSRANRSYWHGTTAAIVAVLLLEGAIAFSIWYCCCCFVRRNSRNTQAILRYDR